MFDLIKPILALTCAAVATILVLAFIFALLATSHGTV